MLRMRERDLLELGARLLSQEDRAQLVALGFDASYGNWALLWARLALTRELLRVGYYRS